MAIAGSHSFGGKTKDRTLRQNRTDGQIHGTRAGIDDLHQKSARGKKKSGTWGSGIQDREDWLTSKNQTAKALRQGKINS
jgi:hypothetical protein